jgi:hypothetical protein
MAVLSRRRKVLRAVGILLLLMGGCGGYNWWRVSQLEPDYKRALEEHLRTNPGDSEAWYALATCGEVAGYGLGPSGPDQSLLQKAIELEDRPLYILMAVRAQAWRGEGRDLLKNHAGNRAALWMELAGHAIEVGELEEASEAFRKALECPTVGFRQGEGIAIHRKFLRRFFGNGFRADTLIVRQLRSEPTVPHYWAIHLADDLIGRQWMSGDLENAQAAYTKLYHYGESSGSRDARWSAARALCALSVERRDDDVGKWKVLADAVQPPSLSYCGNVLYNDDPWIVTATFPRHPWQLFLSDAWVPIWYWMRRGKFHAIAESLGQPDQAAWRRADREIEQKPNPSPLDPLVQNHDILNRPVKDQATCDRLAALECDAAVLTLVRSDWKPRGAVSPSPAQTYVQVTKGTYKDADEATRRQLAKTLVDAKSPLWGPDAWSRAAELHREAFLEAMISSLGRNTGRLAVLREVTGQKLGFDSDAWKRWKALRPKK